MTGSADVEHGPVTPPDGAHGAVPERARPTEDGRTGQLHPPVEAGPRGFWRRPSTFIAVAVVVVVAAILASTTYVPADDESLVVLESFDSENYGPDTFPEVVAEIERTAVDLDELIAALQADEAAASEQFGQQAGTGPYSFPVRGTGIAGDADGGLLPIEMEGVDGEFTIRIQVGPVLTGTALRDAVAIIDFNQFLNQMDYAAAARALNEQVREQVLADVDPEALSGAEVSFVGAFTREPGDIVTITPITLEAAS